MKNRDLPQALDEFVACSENLFKAASALRDILTGEKDVGIKAAQKAESKTYTFSEVRKAFSAKAHEGFTPQIKELISSYGAEKLSAVKEEDYPRLMQDLEKLT